jgi:hypothetical protein
MGLERQVRLKQWFLYDSCASDAYLLCCILDGIMGTVIGVEP